MASGKLLDDGSGPTETFRQLRTAMLLADKGPLRMSQIADHLGYTPTSLTHTVDILIEKKLVKRVSNPQDRRVVVCDLAPGGRIELERISDVVRKRVLAATDMWSIERLESVVEALESIHLSEE